MSQLIIIFSFQWKSKYVNKYPNKYETTKKNFYSAMPNKSQQQN